MSPPPVEVWLSIISAACWACFIWAVLMTQLGSRRPLLSGALAAAGSALAILLVPVQMQGGRELMLAGLALNGLLAKAVQTSMYALAAHVYPTTRARLRCGMRGGRGPRRRHPQFDLRRRDHRSGSRRLLGHNGCVHGVRVCRPGMGAQPLSGVRKRERTIKGACKTASRA